MFRYTANVTLNELLQHWPSTPWMQSITILLGGLALIGVARLFMRTALSRVTQVTPTDLDDKVVSHLHAPLSATILLVYGVIGFSGKDYDMPIAVLSTLVLGIAIDFAIHFIQRYRQLMEEHASVGTALSRIYEEPARAITRNALIIALGFVPMFFASLTPYIIVGIFMASIMVLSWLVSLALLPSIIALFQRGARKAEA